ncbi:MAG: hypothetical protein M0D57_02440 [Sphingobacteriales bacterium JAD_PAG50586_3]|nr:MAG: hypothetical protein M0D57_02440 [Sphingobacteriales bacterium JAD_PAG50586_3]
MRFSGLVNFYLFAAFFGLLAMGVACKTPKQTAVTASSAYTFNVFALEKFFAYPVTDRQPLFLDSGNPQADSLTYQRRTQHWYLLYNTKQYTKKYGPLPKFYPGNVTLEEYKKNPPTVPDEYNRIMFGYN